MLSLKNFIKHLCFYLFRLFPLQKNKVFFDNYFGRGYGCNPKYIAEALHQAYPETDLVWGVKPEHSSNFPSYIRRVRFGSIQAIWEQVTAKVWVLNVRTNLMTRKRKGQFYIQTWHGAIGIKKCEGDAADKISPEFLQRALHDSPMIDLMISNSTFCTQVYQRAFWYKGPIAEFGYPRNDIILKPPAELSVQVRKHFGLDPEKRLFLYAPTFRKDSTTWDSSALDILRLLNALETKFGGSWACLLRLHPWAVKFYANQIPYSSQILNASLYPDIQELLAASNAMATDYSSCIFDFLISRKPAFMFAPDIDSYINERGFLFDPFALPFSCAADNNTIEQNILNFKEEEYIQAVNHFFTEHRLKENGDAAKKTAQFIYKNANKKDFSIALSEIHNAISE